MNRAGEPSFCPSTTYISSSSMRKSRPNRYECSFVEAARSSRTSAIFLGMTSPR